MGLEQYRILRPLTPGGAVEAYDARDAGGREVELWLLDRLATSPEALDQFRRRARLSRLLTHPAALPILDSSLDQAPYFVARPPRPRATLAERFARGGPLRPSDVLPILRQLADVLAAAHRLGIAHGTLSPEAVAWDGDQLRLDFLGIPSSAPGPATTPADDITGAGAVLAWLLRSDARPAVHETIAELSEDAAEIACRVELQKLAGALRAPDPADRPSAARLVARLDELVRDGAAAADLQVTQMSLPEPAAATLGAMPSHLGRFRLVEKLGQGAMGTVYRAVDEADGSTVAVKLLKPDLARDPKALRRFEKEARMLAGVRSAHVANLLEVNEDAGRHFLAMEFVAGRSLRALLDERGKLDEELALSVAADVGRALAAAHACGIVHRDIKPENILLAEDPGSGGWRVKLTDFGLARQVEQSESLELTRDGMVGTPLYMAPEQGHGAGPLDARADVYALGATLFHLLAGRPPFDGSTPVEVLYKHATEPPPRLQALNPALGDATCRLVERSLAKDPADRFADAAAMRDEIERLLRGEPSSLAVHPLQPPADPRRVITYEFRWECRSTPEELWPYVSNTERLNRAIGLPAVRFEAARDGGRLRRFGSFRKFGLDTRWEEHPFEWVEGRRMGVLRVLERGPFEWLTSVVELAGRPAGGTLLTHRFQLVPRGPMGRLAAAVEIGRKARRNLGRVYLEADAAIQRRRPGVMEDPFEPAHVLSPRRQARLQKGIERLIGRGAAVPVAERLGEYLAEAPEQDVTRIRPLAVAERLALDPNQFVNACLHAARDGLLVMLWEILCPTCRIPSQVQDSLRAIREHGRCEACNLDFELDFANSVELIFRAHPDVRPGDVGTYCIGGPAHSPHVAAQVRVAAGERVELALSLGEGAYQLRGPQLGYVIDFRVAPSAATTRWELVLSRRPGPELPRQLAPRAQTLALANDTAQELLVRVERTAPRADALTAARAASLPLFRELFPAETLAPGMLVSITQLTLLVTELDDVDRLYRELGDAEAFNRLHEHFRLLDEAVRGEGGAVVKTTHGGLMASFHEPVAALRAALRMPALLDASERTKDLRLRCAVHRGPAYTATINDRLDYFGSTVTAALQLPRFAPPGGLVLSRAMPTDADVSEYLKSRQIELALIPLASAILAEPFAYQIQEGVR